jgi:transcriptional regulator with PAS, ATPase and Fis domain
LQLSVELRYMDDLIDDLIAHQEVFTLLLKHIQKGIPMIKITLIAPYEALIDLAVTTFREHNDFEALKQADDLVQDYAFEAVVCLEKESYQLELDSDVIIARGSTANALKKRDKYIPVVEIPVAGNDLIRCLYKSKLIIDAHKVAVLGSKNMIFGAEDLSEIVELDIHSYLMETVDDMPALVDAVKDNGCDALIGGVTTCEYAQKIGLTAILMETGKESLWQAITEAKRVALISRMDQENARLFQGILDYAYEGVLAIDTHHNVTLMNATARKTLQIQKKRVAGKMITDIISPSPLLELLIKDEEALEQIIKYQNIRLSVNKANIQLKGEDVGKLVLFQDVTEIQEMEGKIRQKMLARGHVAKHTFDDIIGISPVIRKAVQFAKQISMVDSNILILGETGTGKELFAQSIHNHSRRKKGPFVAINCAALPENLLESELFGYAKGAFTGALKEGKAGLFELAHGGTIFLDEIGEVSANLQSRLLRVLQEKEIRRLGDDKIISVDVRIISASNKDLRELVDQGTFRKDLYFRLDVLKITLPTLQQRREDIPLIAEYFVQQFARAFRKSSVYLSKRAAKLLQSLEFSGNIRELRNLCERLVVLSKQEMITADDVKTILDMERHIRLVVKAETYSSPDLQKRSLPSYQLPQFLNRQQIEAALEATRYNKKEAAKLLGISRASLYRCLKKLQIR